jgi:outer membrane lipoprotein-sorting protein
MSKNLHKNNQGLAHIGLVLLVVVVVAAVGGIGWYVFKKQKDKGASSLSDAVKQAAQKCELDDKDICKFFASWKDSKYYTVTSTSTQGGKASTTTYSYVAPDKYHFTSTGEFAYETISIGNTTYTKDTSDNKWWKQTTKPEEVEKNKGEDLDFEEPAKDEAPEKKTTYKFITKEACDKLTCFKYQVIDPEAKDTTEYIWFDTKDYQLRKTRTESKDGVYEATFSYNKIEINEPSPVKELGANQTVVPGSSTPIDGPSEAELQQIQDQINAESQ